MRVFLGLLLMGGWLAAAQAHDGNVRAKRFAFGKGLSLADMFKQRQQATKNAATGGAAGAAPPPPAAKTGLASLVLPPKQSPPQNPEPVQPAPAQDFWRCAPNWQKFQLGHKKKCVKIFDGADDETAAWEGAEGKCRAEPTYHDMSADLFEVSGTSKTDAANTFIVQNSVGGGELWIKTQFKGCYKINRQTGETEPSTDCSSQLPYACAADQVWVPDEELVRKK